MIGLNFGWQCHRLAVDRVGYVRPFSGRSGIKKVLLLSERDDVSRAQVFSFFLHAHDLEDQHHIEVRELALPRFLNGFDARGTEPDAVLIQTWFDLAPARLQDLTTRIKQAWPEARIAYLDW